MFSICEIKLLSCINEENAIDLLTYADGLQAQLLYVKCVQFITVHTALHDCEELKRLSLKTRSFLEGEFVRFGINMHTYIRMYVYVFLYYGVMIAIVRNKQLYGYYSHTCLLKQACSIGGHYVLQSLTVLLEYINLDFVDTRTYACPWLHHCTKLKLRELNELVHNLSTMFGSLCIYMLMPIMLLREICLVRNF